MKAESIRPGRRDAQQRGRYFASHLFLLLVIGSLLVASASAQTAVAKGSVEGSVFTLDSEGRSYVPGAKVTLQAPNPLHDCSQRRTKGVSIASASLSRDST